MAVRSDIPIGKWRGGASLFNGFTGTRPTHEETGGARVLADLIAPEDGPQLVAEKECGLYFVPCVLLVAPLTGKTLERATLQGLATVGKMRSSAHVTVGAWAKLDGDGLTEEQFTAMRRRLDEADLAYLIYSTHSHGRADKPGIRCRVIVFFDRDLAPGDYQRAVLALSTWLFGESLDPSEARLSQQAGIWMAHPDRADKAFCIRKLDGYCVSSDVLLAMAPAVVAEKRSSHQFTAGAMSVDSERIGLALDHLNSNARQVWIDTAIRLKAAYGDGAFSLWLKWARTADESCRSDESECAGVWDGLAPHISADQGAGALYASARDSALTAVRAAAARGEWDSRARSALVYLRRFHGRLYREMFEVAA